MTILEELYMFTQQSLLANLGYDFIKIIAGFIVAKFLMDGIYMRIRWGGWKLIVMDEDKIEVTRKPSPAVAKRILTDDGELSVYAKGVVSPYARINIDLISEKAHKIGLFKRDEANKIIIIQIDKNPEKAESNAEAQLNTKAILEKIESLERMAMENEKNSGL